MQPYDLSVRADAPCKPGGVLAVTDCVNPGFKTLAVQADISTHVLTPHSDSQTGLLEDTVLSIMHLRTFPDLCRPLSM